MNSVTIDIDRAVFNEAYLPYLECQTDTQIFYGGSSSGKSVFLAQRVVYDLLNSGRNYIVCRQVGRTIRTSVFMEICKIISEWGLTGLFTINKSDMLITCLTGYQVMFAGLDDVEKLKSATPAKGAITDIWVEEATEVDRDSVKQLYKRQRGGRENVKKRMTFSFNPIMQNHWIFTEYFSPIAWADDQTRYSGDDVFILKTTYKDNRFLTSDDVKRLESETDKYFYNVYTLGNWGVLGNVIFTKWRVEDLSDMQAQFTNHRNGLDFGFASDPAAVSRSHYDKKRKTIYIYDELYQSGLTNDLLAAEIKRICDNDMIVCDSAEPKSIVELQQNGVRAVPAEKGPDSVRYGIQWLQQQTVVIDTRCINAINEFRQYKWKEDKAGKPLPQPVEHNDHIIDATRYAYEQDSKEAKIPKEQPTQQSKWTDSEATPTGRWRKY